ncbi:MAG: L,D-transpeptidase [Methyloceanibacter sp.]
MRFISPPQFRLRTLFTAFRLTLAACLAVVLFAQPAAAQSDADANPADLNLDMPTGLDAQPQPIYPAGPLEASEAAGEREDQAEAEAPIEPKTPIIVANIDKTSQEMTVFVDGVEEHRWPVSTGLPGYATPSGTFTTSSMNEIWHSRQWNNTPMPHAVFFTKKGHAVHATDQVNKLGRPASKGCVRLSPKNAKTFYNLVKEHGLDRTEVVLSGSTPGGDYKMAHPDSDYDPYFDYGRTAYPRYAPYRDYRRYGYNEIRPRAERRRRAYQPRNQQRRYRRAPRRGNWFRAPGH